MNSIVSAASGRSVSSRTTSATRLERAAAARRPDRRAARRGASPNAITRRPRPASASSRACSSAGRVIAPGPDEDVGRPDDVAARPALAVERQPAPLPAGREGHLGGDPGRRARGRPRRSSRASGCARRRRRRSGRARARPASAPLGVGADDLDQLERAVGEGAGLVDADRVDGRQRLGGAHLLDERVHPRQAHGGDGEGDAHQQDEALGDQRDQAGGRGLGGLGEVDAADDEAAEHQDRQRDEDDRRRPEDPVDLELQRRRVGGGTPSPGPRSSPRRSRRGRRRPRSGRSRRRRRRPRASGRRAPCGSRRPPRSAATRRRSGRASRSRRRRRRADRRARPGSRRRGRSRRPAARSRRPSRITSARGATSSARLSSVSLALISWRMPIAELTIAITPKSASAQSPWLRTRMKKTRMIPLNSVSVFASTIERTDRLESSSTGPSRRSRAAASPVAQPEDLRSSPQRPPSPYRMKQPPRAAARRQSIQKLVLGHDLRPEIVDPDRAEHDLGLGLAVVVDRAQRLRERSGPPFRGRPRRRRHRS